MDRDGVQPATGLNQQATIQGDRRRNDGAAIGFAARNKTSVIAFQHMQVTFVIADHQIVVQRHGLETRRLRQVVVLPNRCRCSCPAPALIFGIGDIQGLFAQNQAFVAR